MKIRFPGFKILDRYILGKFLSTYFFAIAMIIVIVVIFDYAEKIDDFTATHAPMKAILLQNYLNFIPFFINQFSGLFTFIACIFFTSKMAYQTEIVAMLSGGMSFRRLMWPYFLGALIIASLSLTLNLWVIPRSQRKVIAFQQLYIPKSRTRSTTATSTARSNPVRSPTSAATTEPGSRPRSSCSNATKTDRWSARSRPPTPSSTPKPNDGPPLATPNVNSERTAARSSPNTATSIR